MDTRPEDLVSFHSIRRWRSRMRRTMWFVVSTMAVTIGLQVAAHAQQGGAAPAAPAAPAMTLTVSGFPDGGDIPVKFSQAAPGVAAGEGLSPAISWANAPAGTQSFFLNMRDMDVARNKTTDDQAHWVVWNIPATATSLPEGVPKGPKLANGAYQFSATGQMYRGPGAGAAGTKHHYMFELYALDTVIDVQPAADAFETRANVMK